MRQDTGQSLRTVRCLSNPSGMQAARWRGASRIRAACWPRGGEAQAESERHAGREVERRKPNPSGMQAAR